MRLPTRLFISGTRTVPTEAVAVLRIDAQFYTADDVRVEVSVATFDPAQFQLETDIRNG